MSTSPQRIPLLVQAGWSGRGREFAAKQAELIFIAKSNPLEIRQGLDEIWAQAQARVRQADDVKSLTVLRIVTAKTEIEVQRKYELLQKRGLYRTQPQSGTLRSRLRNDGSSYLPASAHGASFRFV